MALVVVVALTVIDPSPGVFVALAAVIVFLAAVLGMNFPTRGAAGHGPANVGTAEYGSTDFGGEAAERYERERRAD